LLISPTLTVGAAYDLWRTGWNIRTFLAALLSFTGFAFWWVAFYLAIHGESHHSLGAVAFFYEKNPRLVPLVLFLLFLSGVRALWYRLRVRSILARHSGEPPGLPQIQAWLAAVNASSPNYVFSASRYANIPFRGQTITVVFGSVGSFRPTSTSGSMWDLTGTLFAIADTGTIAWLTANSDVFTPAFRSPDAAVFWIRIGKL
jgi:hypothetical protein